MPSDFHAPHIPEEYDGVGADALATCIVIEEVARVCASSSLIPAVNKLGTMPLILAAGRGGQGAATCRPSPRGEAMFSYGLSEREAGSDTASMRCRARADGDDWVLSGQKSWITNAGDLAVLHGAGGDRPRRAGAAPTISAFVVEKSDAGFTFGEQETQARASRGRPTRELHLRRRADPGRPHDRRSRGRA